MPVVYRNRYGTFTEVESANLDIEAMKKYEADYIEKMRNWLNNLIVNQAVQEEMEYRRKHRPRNLTREEHGKNYGTEVF